MIGKKKRECLFILIGVLKNILKFKGNLVHFIKKLAPIKNLNNSFKSKKKKINDISKT